MAGNSSFETCSVPGGFLRVLPRSPLALNVLAWVCLRELLAARQRENAGVAFMGDTKGGAFDVSGEVARAWLALPRNPNGRPNADVLKP